MEGTKFVVMSDTYSVLRTLMNTRRLQHYIHGLRGTNKEVEICWIPGHVGIQGNEKADIVAVAAAHQMEEYILISYRDWYPVIKEAITEEWNNSLRRIKQKMSEVKKNVGPSKQVKGITRREAVVLNRLRAGHSWLPHC